MNTGRRELLTGSPYSRRGTTNCRSVALAVCGRFSSHSRPVRPVGSKAPLSYFGTWARSLGVSFRATNASRVLFTVKYRVVSACDAMGILQNANQAQSKHEQQTPCTCTHITPNRCCLIPSRSARELCLRHAAKDKTGERNGSQTPAAPPSRASRSHVRAYMSRTRSSTSCVC